MKTGTVLDQIEWAKGASRWVTIELRHGRVFRGLVESVMAKGDAVEVTWFEFNTDLIESKEVVAISVRRL